MRWLRALTLTGLVALVLFAAASVFSLAPPDAAHACSQSCETTGSGTRVARTGTAPATTCVRDAGCGGGGALTSMGTPLLIGVAAVAITFVATLLRRRFRNGRIQAFAGTLLASRLFHPPQFVLGS
jgi:hypothetical protein